MAGSVYAWIASTAVSEAMVNNLSIKPSSSIIASHYFKVSEQIFDNSLKRINELKYLNCKRLFSKFIFKDFNIMIIHNFLGTIFITIQRHGIGGMSCKLRSIHGYQNLNTILAHTWNACPYLHISMLTVINHKIRTPSHDNGVYSLT